jgi:branched-subunit amino acid transport protein
MSNKAKFWVGVVLAIPAVVVGPLVIAAALNLGQVISADGPLGGVLSGVAALLLLAGLVTLMVVERTRWVGLGMLAGVAILLILAAGACVVLLVAISNSYS